MRVGPAAGRGDRPEAAVHVPLERRHRARRSTGTRSRRRWRRPGSGCSRAATSTTGRAACSPRTSTTPGASSRSATSRTCAARTGWPNRPWTCASQNTWPSLGFDVKAVNQLAGRFLGPGFYYKTFIKPQRLWPLYERVLQRFVHAGQVSPDTPRTAVDKRYAHPDVLVAGGGPAGMAAAVAAAQAGARVMLVEEEHRLGGHLRWGDGAALAALAELRDQVAATPGIEVLTNAVVAGRYDGNWTAVVQRGSAGRSRAAHQGAREGPGGRARADRAALRLRRQRRARGDAVDRGAPADQPARGQAGRAGGRADRQRRRRRGRRGPGPGRGRGSPGRSTRGPARASSGSAVTGGRTGRPGGGGRGRDHDRVRPAGDRDRLDRAGRPAQHGRRPARLRPAGGQVLPRRTCRTTCWPRAASPGTEATRS